MYIPSRFGRVLPQLEFTTRQAMASAQIYRIEGRYDDAAIAIKQGLLKNSAHLGLHQQQFQLALVNGSDKKIKRAAAELLLILFAQGRPIEAVSVWREVELRIAHYRPEQGDLVHLLGAELVRQQRWQDAWNMLQDIRERHPGYPQLGDAALVLAQICIEHFNDLAQAKTIVSWVEAEYPQALKSAEGWRVAQQLPPD